MSVCQIEKRLHAQMVSIGCCTFLIEQELYVQVVSVLLLSFWPQAKTLSKGYQSLFVSDPENWAWSPDYGFVFLIKKSWFSNGVKVAVLLGQTNIISKMVSIVCLCFWSQVRLHAQMVPIAFVCFWLNKKGPIRILRHCASDRKYDWSSNGFDASFVFLTPNKNNVGIIWFWGFWPKTRCMSIDFAFCSSDKQIIMFGWLQFPWSPAQTSTSCANCSLNTFVFLIEQKRKVQTMSVPLVILIPKQEQCSNGLIFCFLIQIDMFIWMFFCVLLSKKSVCSDNFCCVVHLIQRYTTAS